MKLSDLIFESQILLEDTFEIRKNPNGRTWGVYNTTVTPNVLISSHKSENQAKIKADQLRNPKPPKPKDLSKDSKSDSKKASVTKPPVAPSPGKLSPGLTQTATSKWTMVLPDGETVYQINNERDAKKFEKIVNKLEQNGTSPKDIAKEMAKKVEDGTTFSKKIKNTTKSVSTVQKYMQKYTLKTAKQLKTDGLLKELGGKSTIMKMILGPGATTALIVAQYLALQDVKADKEAATDATERAELQEVHEILAGQMYATLIIAIMPYLKNAKIARRLIVAVKRAVQLKILKVGAMSVVRTGGLGAAVSVKGTFASLLASEAIGVLAFFLIANPAVQRYFAEWLAGSLLGDILGFIGQQASNAIVQLDELLDGAYGTDFLRRNLSTEEFERKGLEGEYYSDSEWAKQVFGALLFPGGVKSRLVPYIAPNKREELMSALLEVKTEQPDPDATDPRGKDQIPPAPGPTTTTAKPNPRQGYESGQDAQQSNPSYIN